MCSIRVEGGSCIWTEGERAHGERETWKLTIEQNDD